VPTEAAEEPPVLLGLHRLLLMTDIERQLVAHYLYLERRRLYLQLRELFLQRALG
jgi:hypothetical protein